MEKSYRERFFTASAYLQHGEREREDKESVRVKDREGKRKQQRGREKGGGVCVRERVLTNNNYT